MSPSGDSLRNYCRSFPGLVGNTTIDWMSTWPKQALRSVAKGFISENRKIPDSLKDAINDHVVHVHESLAHYTREFLEILRRPNYITPKHYLVSLPLRYSSSPNPDVLLPGLCRYLRSVAGREKFVHYQADCSIHGRHQENRRSISTNRSIAGRG